ncbi:MAG: hypothetical protein K2W95_25415 [Candidatus Obscuribacterales bacterium]|nr:hypothetical protein [Candidatus Obscuribacterales bacterium]
MYKYVSSALTFLLLIIGATFLCSAAFEGGPDRIYNAVAGLAVGGLGVAALIHDRRLPAYAAVKKLSEQIDELAAETKPASPALRGIYDDMLTQARFHLDVANAKLRHREWRYAVHTANMGMQNIKNYRDAAAATNADPRKL